MALSVTNNGTLTATAAQQTLGAEKTDLRVYVLQVDLLNMAAGDVVELRAKVKVLTGSTTATAFRATYANAQADPVVQTPPIPCGYGVTFTLVQTAGTNRDYPWAIIQL